MKTDYLSADVARDLDQHKKRKHFLSLIRLVLFVGMVATFILGLTDLPWLLLAFVALVAVFFRMVLVYSENKDRISFLEQILEMQKEASLRKNRDLKGFDAGLDFLDKSHPFANDLDLFGQHSLFQLLNHTVGKEGRQRLADWMKGQMEPGPARKRQGAINGLKDHLDFVRDFEGIGRAFLTGEKSKKPFYLWLAKSEDWKAWYYLPMIVGPLGGLLFLVLGIMEVVQIAWLGIWILLGMACMSVIFLKMKTISESMPNLSDLKTFKKWVLLLENISFKDSYLIALQSGFLTKDVKGSNVLAELEQKTFLLQNRYNLMYLLLNMFLWFDFFLYFKALRWKANHGHLMADWEERFTEWQVLVSLAAFSNEEMLDNMPDWTEKNSIVAKNIKHPLLRSDLAIGNDFALDAGTKTILLTGSNMSGKTTFMRTLGINMVLSNMGLGIFGIDFQIGSYWLFTSMRNTDNLGESVSSFYAELGRIKNLLDMAARGQAVFYLLDEILKGTNTLDRVMGSEALIRQLSESACKGIISTHDIELSQLEQKLPFVLNKSFHSQIFEDKIHFDFTLKEGPCPSFNAHKLMELMGIKFEE